MSTTIGRAVEQYPAPQDPTRGTKALGVPTELDGMPFDPLEHTVGQHEIGA